MARLDERLSALIEGDGNDFNADERRTFRSLQTDAQCLRKGQNAVIVQSEMIVEDAGTKIVIGFRGFDAKNVSNLLMRRAMGRPHVQSATVSEGHGCSTVMVLIGE